MIRCLPIIAAAVMISTSFGPALAGPECHDGKSFSAWLVDIKAEAKASGIKEAAIDAALAGIAFDPSIIRHDRGQSVFQQTFLQFSDRMVSSDRMSRGKKLLSQYAGLFDKIEREFGVPGPVLVAFWGLESDFGSDPGKIPIIQAVATLAYDCRRADVFHVEFLDAIRLVERGDLKPSEMLGDWAGELGHMQISPPQYVKYGVDYDGDGRSDVIHSIPDAMATAANFLKGLGWQRGQPWVQEVRVPETLPWEEADLTIQHPRSYWVQHGVAATSGSLPSDDLAASLVLPMGHTGPAFLAYPNFQAYLGWNKAYVYSLTAAYYATRLEGAPVVSHASGITALSPGDMKALQEILVARGLSQEAPDGRLGTDTRAAVKQAQLKLGLPADGYPTADLLARLK
jgi:lytic murein transglycosylase